MVREGFLSAHLVCSLPDPRLGSTLVPGHQLGWNQQCSQAAAQCASSWEDRLLLDLLLRHRQARKLEITNRGELWLQQLPREGQK